MYRSIALIALLGAAQALNLDVSQCCNTFQHSCCGDHDQKPADHANVEEIMTSILENDAIVIPEAETDSSEFLPDTEGSLPHIPAVTPAV